MKCWDMPSINIGFANGAEVGLKIAENFKESDMVDFLKNYADGNGIGGNILTSTLKTTHVKDGGGVNFYSPFRPTPPFPPPLHPSRRGEQGRSCGIFSFKVICTQLILFYCIFD